MKDLNLTHITEEVKKIALEAGKFLLAERQHFELDKIEQKGAHDYVSYVDKNSENLIVSRLKSLLPEAGFIAEEGTGSLEEQEFCWVVDPLDGTSNFIHNNAPFCVSIALRNKNEILVGVVYECTRNELFWANKESKSYMNGKEITVSQQSNMDQAFIELGFPYNAEGYRTFVLKMIEDLYGHVGCLRLMGSAAAEICYVAAGRFDARIEGFIGPWDIAAGNIILQQAGGKMTDFSGNTDHLDGKEVFASNGRIHDDLLTIIQKHKKHIKA